MISVYYQIRARVTRYLVYAGTSACHKAGTQHCLQYTRRRYGHKKAGPVSLFLGRPSGSRTHFSIAAGPLPDRYRQTSAINKCFTLHRHPGLLLRERTLPSYDPATAKTSLRRGTYRHLVALHRQHRGLPPLERYLLIRRALLGYFTYVNIIDVCVHLQRDSVE